MAIGDCCLLDIHHTLRLEGKPRLGGRQGPEHGLDREGMGFLIVYCYSNNIQGWEKLH